MHTSARPHRENLRSEAGRYPRPRLTKLGLDFPVPPLRRTSFNVLDAGLKPAWRVATPLPPPPRWTFHVRGCSFPSNATPTYHTMNIPKMMKPPKASDEMHAAGKTRGVTIEATAGGENPVIATGRESSRKNHQEW